MNHLKADTTIAPHHHLTKWAGIFLFFSIPLTYAHNGHNIVLFTKLFIAQIGTLLLSFAWFQGSIRNNIPHRHYPLDLPVILFLFLHLLSWTTLSINPFKSGIEVVKIATFTAFYFALTRTFHHSHLKPWIFVITIVTALISIVGICQYFSIAFLWLRTGGLPSATLVMRNIAAMYLICVIPLTVLPFIWTKRLHSEIVWGFLFSLPIIFLVYTRTRGAWVGLGLAFCVSSIWFLITQRKNLSKIYTSISRINKSKYYVAFFYLIIIGIMITRPPNTFNASSDSVPQYKTNVIKVAQSITQGQDTPRFILWTHTYHMIQDHWLYGVGLGNWELIYPKYERGELTRPDYYALRPHNDLLWIFSEFGIIGLLILSILWCKTAVVLFQNMQYTFAKPHHSATQQSCLHKNAEQNQFIILSVLGISLIALSIHACFSFPKERISSLFFFYFIVGLASVFSSQQAKISQGAKYHHFIAPLHILSLILGMVFSYRAIEADRSHYRLSRHLTRNDWSQVIQTADKATKHGVIDHWILFWKSHALHRQGNTEQALASFKTCLSFHPNEKAVYWKIGLLEQSNGNWHSAQTALERAVFLDVNNPDFHQDLGIVYQHQGNMQAALKSYQQALSLSKSNLKVYINLGRIYEELDQPQKAIQLYQHFLEHWQGDTTTTNLVQNRLHILKQHPSNNINTKNNTTQN